MKKNIALISVFAILIIAFSGCIGNNTPPANGTDSNNSKANVTPDEKAISNNTPPANGTSSNNLKANLPADEKASEISNTKNLPADEKASEISKIKNLPAGFEYVSNPPLSADRVKIIYNVEDISGILGGSEGLYKYSNKSGFYIDVIQLENKEAANNFISTYKSSFTPLNEGSRFAEESFNGHSATRITDSTIDAGKTIPRYIYIWSNENYVLVVTGNTVDSSLLRQLAVATGY
jgi:hypothetical protein